MLQITIWLNHQPMLYLCRRNQSSLSSPARGKRTTSRVRKTPSFRATPGKNLTPSKWNGIPIKSRLTCRRRIRSGSTLERTLQTQRHNLQRILQSPGTIRKATFWTRYPSHHLHHLPDIHTRLHILHQESIKMLLTPSEPLAAHPYRIPILGRKSHTSISLVVGLRAIVLLLIRRLIEINRSFCRIPFRHMPSAQILDGHRQTTDLLDHINPIVHLLTIELLHRALWVRRPPRNRIRAQLQAPRLQ
jgi:hypothetical protein